MKGYEVALAHAALGRNVFPFKLIEKPDGKFDKVPLIEWKAPPDGLATTDEATIVKWWKHWPDAYAGWALPGGTVLADIDDRDDFAATGLVLPEAPHQTTIRGGEHRLYRADGADQTVKEVDGLDTRVGGKGWAALYSVDAFAGDPPPAPDWLVHTKANGTFTKLGLADGPPIADGARDNTLTSLAGSMRHRGMTAIEICAALIEVNKRCRPPLSVADVRRIADSIGSKPPGEPERRPSILALSWPDLMAEPETPPPTIRPGIPEVGVTVLAGSPKAGKTLWTSQMALESRRSVLLIIEEGALSAIAYRLRRQAEALGIETPPVTLMHRQRIRLDDRASVAALRGYVAETAPALVILDPLNRLHTADENKPAAMTPVMDALAELAYEDGGRAVVAVHHVNKPSADRRGDIWDRLRGASSIRSGTDANLILDGDRGSYRRLVGEFRDAEPLTEHIDLDRDSLLFRAADAPEAAVKVDAMALRLFVTEQRAVTTASVMDQFGVTRNTALYALRAHGCDEFEGPRRRLTFSLGE